MSYGEFCKHFKITHSPDAFIIWLYYSFYKQSPRETRPNGETP